MPKDYSSISPSAKSLLLAKGLTNIPFARKAAELISRPDKYIPDINNPDFLFWFRVIHFEDRYFSIDKLMADISLANALELSSGFSFRGLEITNKKANIHYIDTDLPGIVDVKQQLLSELAAEPKDNSQLELLPLNAVDEMQFTKTIKRFDKRPLTIVNEGLLMYLDDAEKTQLCRNIHSALKERGGYWITADIYIKTEYDTASVMPDDELSKLVAAHKIDEKKFESFEQAEAFFKEMGFVIDKKLEPNYMECASFQSLLKVLPPEVRDGGKAPPKFRETWRLKIAG